MYVRDFMTDKVIAIPPSLELSEALELMTRRSVRRLPVVEKDKLVGIITKSDLYAALGPVESLKSQKARAHKTVGEVMTANPATVTAEETLEAAASLMYRKRISGLPVVAGEKLVGVITETDVFRAMIEMLGFAEKGARIAFELDNPENLLAQVQKKSANLVIRGLVCYHNQKADRWNVLMKLRGRETVVKSK